MVKSKFNAYREDITRNTAPTKLSINPKRFIFSTPHFHKNILHKMTLPEAK